VDPFPLAEILAARHARTDEVTAAFSAIAPDQFFTGDAAHWGPAHHLGHLALTHRTIARGLRARDRLAPAAGGPVRRYAAVREAYLAALAATPPAALAANPFTPATEPAAGVAAAVGAYRDAAGRLEEALAGWSEADLDAKALAHPLLGPIPVREMLLFCLYHDAHHLEGLRRTTGG
jgi:hypothetical protein